MAANPRAAAVAALVRQEQDGFSNLVLDAELNYHLQMFTAFIEARRARL